MTTWITICDTCKRDGWEDSQMELTDGEVLADLIENQAKESGLNTRRVSCLMGCKHGCNVTIQGAGKLAYTLCDFTADAEAASAIVDYARAHASSTSGQVPYREWPQGVKGHFITRHPPLPSSS